MSEQDNPSNNPIPEVAPDYKKLGEFGKMGKEYGKLGGRPKNSSKRVLVKNLKEIWLDKTAKNSDRIAAAALFSEIEGFKKPKETQETVQTPMISFKLDNITSTHKEQEQVSQAQPIPVTKSIMPPENKVIEPTITKREQNKLDELEFERKRKEVIEKLFKDDSNDNDDIFKVL